MTVVVLPCITDMWHTPKAVIVETETVAVVLFTVINPRMDGP